MKLLVRVSSRVEFPCRNLRFVGVTQRAKARDILSACPLCGKSHSLGLKG